MADERIGASFTIDVNNLKAGLKTANKLIRESQAEFKAAAAGLDKYSDAQKIAQAKIKSLNDIIPQQEKKVDALKKQYEKLKNSVDENGKAFDETSDRAIELRTQIAREEAALKENKAELDKQTQALNELEKSGGDAARAIEDVGNETEKTSGAFTVMKGALANLVADGFRLAISKAKEFATAIVEVGISFDDSMAKVAAVSGATGEEIDKLREKAKEMGSSTKFTASEAAEAFNYMAMAGWKTEQMISGIDGILNLAAASGSDLATTSDIVTDALTAMGYAAEDAGKLADVMAAASSNANTNVEMMGQTFQYAAPIVGALGYSMEDTAVAIGLMANAGIKGEKAGTALRSILTRLSAPPKECADAMTALGVSITDGNGKMKTLDTIMRELQISFGKLSETEQTAMAKHIAGQEAMSGLLAVVNAAPADFNKLTEAVKNSNGAAEEMANTMLDTLGGDMTILKSQIEGVQLTIFEKLSPTLRSAVKDAQNFIDKVDWNKFGKKAGDVIAKVATTAKSFAKNVLPTLGAALKVAGGALKILVDNFGWLAPAVLTAVTAFKAFKAVMAVTTAITAAKTAVAGLTAGVGLATKAQTIWNAAMAANPIGAVVTAVALLATGIGILISKQKSAKQSTDELSESQENAITKAHEAAEAYREQKEAAAEMAAADIANVDYVKNNLLPQLQNIVDANGKVKQGEEERAQFILGELNKALGTEYTQLSDIIDANGRIKDSIYKVIEAKKAQILLEAHEEDYKKAVQETAKAEKARVQAAQEVADAEWLVSTFKKELINQQERYNEAQESGNLWEMYLAKVGLNEARSNLDERKKLLAEKQEAYNKANSDVQQYYKDIDSYEQASTAILQGETEKAIGILNEYSGSFKTVESTAKLSADEQKKILQQQVIDTEVNLQLMEADYAKYENTMTDDQKKAAKARIDNARKQANDAKAEFHKVGGNITKGMADGAEKEEWTLTGAMKNLISKAVKAAKNAAGIKSPSRLFRTTVGQMIGAGVALGVDDSTKSVLNSVKNQVKAIQRGYDFGGFSTSVNAGVNGSGQGAENNGSRSVVVNQYNTYSQAHSRYEIYKSKQQTAAAVRLALGTV